MAGPFTFVPSGTVTASGSTGALGISTASNLVLQVNVSAASGTTPSLALSLQWSNDGINFGAPDGGGDTFTALTTTGAVVKVVQPKGLFLKVVWTVTGTTPSFTFSVVGAY